MDNMLCAIGRTGAPTRTSSQTQMVLIRVICFVTGGFLLNGAATDQCNPDFVDGMHGLMKTDRCTPLRQTVKVLADLVMPFGRICPF